MKPPRTLTAEEMKAVDRYAIDTIGIPAVCLMENAGRAAADEALKMLRRRGKTSSEQSVVIVCGSGNNGGDGLVTARHLLNRGVRVAVIHVGRMTEFSPDSAINYRAARTLKIPFFKVDSKGLGVMRSSDLIVDALLGVGLSRPVSGLHRAVIEAVNGSGVPVLAVDIPSGLDATTGRVQGASVKADVTVTLAYPKKGLFVGEGPRYAGRLVVADIGIPYQTRF